MRGLKDVKSARLFTEGWLLHYNYFRPHESLKDRTPAEVAGVRFPYRNWHNFVAKRKVVTPAQTSTTSYTRIPDLPKAPTFTESGFRVSTKRHKRAKRRTRKQPKQTMAILTTMGGENET